MTWFNDLISSSPPAAQTIISVAIMLMFGFLVTRITKLLKLPNVTAYILAGILIGPYCLNLIPKNVAGGMDFLADIALAFIAFSVGEFFKFSNLKKSGWKIIILTLFEALMASMLVFCVMFFVFGLSLSFSIVLAALASATAPASTIMTIRQTKAKGNFVDKLLQVVALDDVVSLIAYSIAISVALAAGAGSGFNFEIIILPILKNILALGIGALLGFLMKFLLSKRSTDNRLIIVVCILFIFCGICSLLDVSPLLGCMAIGTVYINVTNDEKLFAQTNYFSPPILLLFFVRSGLNFNFDVLFSSTSIIGSSPLWIIGIVYFLVRIGGKYLGAFVGSVTTKQSKEIRNYLGLALIPQAGVAIGLATLGARTLGGNVGEALQTIILASSVLYELVGPVCAKLSLYLSKSYSKNLEDIAPVSEQTESGNQKTEVELLIERIQTIREEIKKDENQLSKEEEAFTEASEEYDEGIFVRQKNGIHRRNKF